MASPSPTPTSTPTTTSETPTTTPTAKSPAPMARAKLVDLGTTAEQAILDLMASAYSHTLAAPDFDDRLHSIKKSFQVRDYVAVFQPENLPTYLVNYVPSRALAYYTIFARYPALLKLIRKRNMNLCCLGGGPGSEVLGAAMVAVASKRDLSLTVHIHDNADWEESTDELFNAIESVWGVNENILKPKHYLTDILGESKQLSEHLSTCGIISLMFTVNELFVKKKEAMEFIKRLRDQMKPGAYLLIVDSAGSFSEITISGRKYMIYELFDFFPGFEKVISENSTWYRQPEDISFPLKLNNYRYFIRLYRKL